jgi:hypothetical protein
VWRSLMWVVAIALAVGVGYVVVDAARRAATLSTFTQGIGTPDNPSREAEREAEWNLIYLLGLAVGSASGLGVAVAGGLCWRLVRTRRTAAEPGVAPDRRPASLPRDV